MFCIIYRSTLGSVPRSLPCQTGFGLLCLRPEKAAASLAFSLRKHVPDGCAKARYLI